MITIYGKKNCGKCESAKQKLELMGFKYVFIDLTDPPPEWRETKTTEARAMYEDLVDAEPDIALPLIDVPPLLTYPQAMKALKKK